MNSRSSSDTVSLRPRSNPNADKAEGGRGTGTAVKKVQADQLPVHVGESEEAQEQQGEIIEAKIEEADPKRVIATPTLPSQSDVEEHRECHLPYASWCDHCVEGRGREMGHHTVNRGTRAIPTI